MGKVKKTRKFAAVKRLINPKDMRIKENQKKEEEKKKTEDEKKVRRIEQSSSALFFQYNTQLGPPYRILVDTNFINFSIQNKLDLFQAMTDCLYAKCIPYITDCVMAEIEKLGSHYRVCLRIAKDPRFERLPCMHKGTYADDCLVNRITQMINKYFGNSKRSAEKVDDSETPAKKSKKRTKITGFNKTSNFIKHESFFNHKCYIVATCDRDLKRRIRKVPGVPIMYLSKHKYSIERMPDDFGAPRR